jgi:hypothetical protein
MEPKFKEGERVKWRLGRYYVEEGFGTVRYYHPLQMVYSVDTDGKKDVVFCYEHEMEKLDANL